MFSAFKMQDFKAFPAFYSFWYLQQKISGQHRATVCPEFFLKLIIFIF